MLHATLKDVLSAAKQRPAMQAAFNAHSSRMILRELRGGYIHPPKKLTAHHATARVSLRHKTTRVCANDTARPSAQRSSLTKPSTGAVTATSIFMDSMSTKVSPALTL